MVHGLCGMWGMHVGGVIPALTPTPADVQTAGLSAVLWDPMGGQSLGPLNFDYPFFYRPPPPPPPLPPSPPLCHHHPSSHNCQFRYLLPTITFSTCL